MPPKILKSAAEIVKDAIKAVEAEKKAGKTGEILESRTAPATTPRGGTLLPRSQGMYPPDVPQVDLPRQKGVDKARAEGKKPKYTERMQSLLDSPTVRKKVDKLIAKGQDLGMQEWYGTEPLRQVALDVISPQQYESLMAQLASASQRNPVDQQNLMGSYLYYLQQQGKLDPEAVLLTNKLKEQGLEGISAPLIEFPEGYGSLAQSAIFERGKQIASGDIAGALPPEKKLGTFYRNLLGNLQPVTVDVNAVRGPVIEAGDPRWLTSKLVEKDEAGKVKNVYFPRQMVEEGEMSIREAKQRPGFWEAAPSGSEYAGFEDLWQRAARREGVAPAEAQALGWYGSADVTALKTKPELYVDNLERLLNRTAEVTGKSPLEVLRQFLKGEEFLKKAKGGSINLEAEYRMGKGGLLKKAAKAVSEAVEPVLPTAERQANLERFLEGSATKQRLYHGTNKDISTFESGRPVQWLAENPELANQFVAGGRRKMGSKPSKGSVVYPVHAKVKNLLDLTDATPQKAMSTVDFLKQAGVDTSPENLRRLAEWDYELNKAYGGGSHLEDPVGSRIERMQYPEPLWSLLDRHMVIKALEDQGYDGVKLTEKFGNKEPYGESQTIGVFNPANIKSATGNVGTYDVGATDITKANGGPVKMADGGGLEEEYNLRKMGMDPTRVRGGYERKPISREEIQAMMLDVPAGLGVPFAEAGSYALRGKTDEAKESAAIEAALIGVPGAAVLAKPAYRAVKKSVQKAGKTVKDAIQPTAPQDEALRIAQKNAAKPVSEGGLGLPPDNTPMDRARAMGYGDPIYRGYQFGTGRNKATFYSSSPDLASAYAVRDPGFQYEVLSGGDRHLFRSLDEAKIAQQDVGGKIKKLKEAPTVQKNVMRSPKPLVIDAEGSNWNFIRNPFAPPENFENLQRRLNSVSKNLVINGKPYTVNQQKADILRDEYFNVYTDTNSLAELAKKRGYDSITIKNLFDVPLSAAGTDKDVKSLLSDVSISLKPENVRSRFAAFDPARIDENDLLAGFAALGITAPMLTSEEPEYRSGGAVMKSGGKVKSAADMFHAKGYQALMDFDNKTKKRKG